MKLELETRGMSASFALAALRFPFCLGASEAGLEVSGSLRFFDFFACGGSSISLLVMGCSAW